MPATLQPSLDLRHADGSRPVFVRPMVGAETFKAVTGKNEDEMLAEIQTGRVRWAFNVSAEGRGRPGDHRIFPRIWVRSIDCYRFPSLPQPAAIEDFFSHWLPAVSNLHGTLLGTTLQKLLNISGDHVADLISNDLIAAAPRAVTTGTQGSPRIQRASVEQFLRARWLGRGQS